MGCLMVFVKALILIQIFNILSLVVAECEVFQKIQIENLLYTNVFNVDVLLTINLKKEVDSGKLSSTLEDLHFLSVIRGVEEDMSFFVEEYSDEESLSSIWVQIPSIDERNTVNISVTHDCLHSRDVAKLHSNGSFYYLSSSGDCSSSGRENVPNFNGKMLKAGSSYYVSTGDSDRSEHSHVISGEFTDTVGVNYFHDYSSESFMSPPTHNHIYSFNTNLTSAIPPYMTFFVCKERKHRVRSKFGTESLFLLMENDQFSTKCHYEDRFIMFSDSHGEKGGDYSHKHYVTEKTISGSTSQSNYGENTQSTTTKDHNHKVPVGGGYVEESSNIPQFFSVMLCEVHDIDISYHSKTGEGILENTVFLTDSIPPLGYKARSEMKNRYVRLGRIFGKKGGTTHHKHSYKWISSKCSHNIGSKMINSNCKPRAESNHRHIIKGDSENVENEYSHVSLIPVSRKDSRNFLKITYQGDDNKCFGEDYEHLCNNYREFHLDIQSATIEDIQLVISHREFLEVSKDFKLSDLHFVENKTNIELYFWEESYVDTIKESVIWVTLPSLVVKENTTVVIKAYFVCLSTMATKQILTKTRLYFLSDGECKDGFESHQSAWNERFIKIGDSFDLSDQVDIKPHRHFVEIESSGDGAMYTTWNSGCWRPSTHTDHIHNFAFWSERSTAVPSYQPIKLCSFVNGGFSREYNISDTIVFWSSLGILDGFESASKYESRLFRVSSNRNSGGNDTHTHELVQQDATLTLKSGMTWVCGTTYNSRCVIHEHKVPAKERDWFYDSKNIPPYLSVFQITATGNKGFFEINSERSKSFLSGVVILSEGIPPKGYKKFGKFPDGKFLRGSSWNNSWITGGNDDHRHYYSFQTGENENLYDSRVVSGNKNENNKHHHSITGETEQSSNELPFVKFVLIQRKSISDYSVTHLPKTFETNKNRDCITKRVECPNGFIPIFSNITGFGCHKCKATTFANYSGEISECSQCPIGFYCDGTDGQKHKCGDGSVAEKPGTEKCKICNDGTYGNVIHSTCLGCESGYFCQNGMRFECENGTVSGVNETSCNVCNDSFYSNDLHTSCILCESGHYCINGFSYICKKGEISKDGASKCTVCPEATFEDNVRTVCRDCTPGSFCTNGIRFGCVDGTISKEKQSKCEMCKKKTYGNKERTYCVLCDKGYYCDGKNGTKSSCGKGTISGVGQVQCDVCGDGYYASVDHTDCKDCVVGYYCVDGEENHCEKGRFSNETKQSSCKSCMKEHYGYYSTDGIHCGACPKGYFSKDGIICSCARGYYSESGKCLICDVGYACGDGNIEKCKKGRFTNETGMEQCLICSDVHKGYYSDNGVNCTSCQKGFYSYDGIVCRDTSIAGKIIGIISGSLGGMILSIISLFFIIITILVCLQKKREKKYDVMLTQHLLQQEHVDSSIVTESESVIIVEDDVKITTELPIRKFEIKNFKEKILQNEHAKLGEGQYGSCFAFEFENQKFAFKWIKTEFNKENLEELITLSRLNHQNIIRTFGYSVKPFGIITELGKHTVQEMIKSREFQMPMKTKKKILLSVCYGLKYLHSKSIYLKWSNVVVSVDNCVKLIDFGVCANLKEEGVDKTTLVGNTFHVAPEVVSNISPYEKASDVFSFGIMIYELIYRTTNPFGITSKYDMLNLPYSIFKGKRPVIIDSDQGMWYAELMKKCWHQQPSKRPTFSQIIDVITKNWEEDEYENPLSINDI